MAQYKAPCGGLTPKEFEELEGFKWREHVRNCSTVESLIEDLDASEDLKHILERLRAASGIE